MSYNYTCATIEQSNETYIFEIKITYFDNTIVKQRIISMDCIGDLIVAENNIKKIKIIFCKLNSMEIITLRKNFTQPIENIETLYKNDIIIILVNNNNINIKYQVI